MKVVLAATDGSECGTAALKQAAQMANTDGAQLVVMSVIPRNIEPRATNSDLTEYARAEHLAGDEAEALSLIVDDVLAEARVIVAEHYGGQAIYVSRAGDPAEEILACARERSADMIVLGTRGRGPLGALVLGSVSRPVANSAGCAVTIVPRGE